MINDRAEQGGSAPAPPSTRQERPLHRRRWFIPAFTLIAIAVLAVGCTGGTYQSKLAEVQKNDNASYLPGSAESTKVDVEAEKFNSVQTLPGFVVYQRDGGLTDADRAKITDDVAAFGRLDGVAADQVGQPVFSEDGTTASVQVPIVAKVDDVEIDGVTLSDIENEILETARADAPEGLEVLPAGPGGLLVAFVEAFEGLDGALLFAALGVVVVILLVVYRSPMLWFFPLISALMALGASSMVVYLLARNDVLTLTGQSQGILSVIVIGAGTDYALLLVSRYREELHAHERRLDAMAAAWRGAAPAIIASAVTVILGLLCLALGELNSNKSLGPVCAIGIACTLVVMLTFLPGILVLFGRWVFWPRVPHVDHKSHIATHGGWSRFAVLVGQRRRVSWGAAAVLLLICVAFLPTLRTNGLSTIDSFTTEPDAIVGQRIYDEHFDQGAGAPAVIIANADRSEDVIAAASTVEGVVQGPGGVCVQVDYRKISQLLASGALSQADLEVPGCAPPEVQVQPVDGRIVIEANIVDRYDTDEAVDTILRLRDAVHAVEGADALVGGATAVNYDVEVASRHDRNLVIPIVLVVILAVLGVLLRALVAPVLLILTVVFSFAASLGVSALFFNHVFGFADADPAFPLFAFVFLVALGIDYNIFLMTRVREEAVRHGTHAGITRGLAVTGGVITSAGIVLAATFAVLAVLPLVFLAEVGFTVAFGVLLDTIVVRSVLVPALSHEIGRRIWWPHKLSRRTEDDGVAAGLVPSQPTRDAEPVSHSQA
ncbi:MAG: MMPL family transporter [Frankia sp.]|nr:MMPL family transporter [Frankia sp.]